MSFIHQKRSSIGVLKGLQVLVVDNDRDSRYLYEALLKGCGANVITAASVNEAIDILSWLLPNILICETRFYGESISTLTTKLSAMEASGEKHIPAIAITTWITDNLAQILEAGFERFLLKPIDLDHLVNLIRDLVTTSRKSPPPYSLTLKTTARKRRNTVSVSE